jgi:fructose-bisphosphate aldolase class II
MILPVATPQRSSIVRRFRASNHDYLQGQIGNPENAEKPNKKYYDPRMCLRSAEEKMADRLCIAAKDFENVLN